MMADNRDALTIPITSEVSRWAEAVACIVIQLFAHQPITWDGGTWHLELDRDDDSGKWIELIPADLFAQANMVEVESKLVTERGGFFVRTRWLAEACAEGDISGRVPLVDIEDYKKVLIQRLEQARAHARQYGQECSPSDDIPDDTSGW